jgi:hypothetical protein
MWAFWLHVAAQYEYLRPGCAVATILSRADNGAVFFAQPVQVFCILLVTRLQLSQDIFDASGISINPDLFTSKKK